MNGIFGSSVLDVAIGLAYIYLLLALFCTTFNEWISGWLNKRGELLAKGLEQLLDQQAHPAKQGDQDGFLSLFKEHPLIAGLKSVKPNRKDRLPAYLSPGTFATAVMDVATVGKAGAITFDDLETAVKNLDDGDVKKTLLALLQNCNSDLVKAQQKIEAWFNEFMDRVSGCYKRWVQILTIVIAFLVVAALNADTVRIAKSLWQDPSLRNVIAEQAKARASSPVPAVVVEYKDKNDPKRPTAIPPTPFTQQEIKALDQVLGWRGFPQGLAWLSWLLGVVITTVAVSLGAPFWFDTLQRIVNLRTAGKSSDERAQQTAKSNP